MDKFDEYKFFAESTQHLSERRQAATQTYLTVNTAIFAVVGFLVEDAEFKEWDLVVVSLPLFLVGILACWIWHKLLTQYKRLIGFRYDQLMEMENAIEGCHQMYIKEWEDFFKPISEKEKFGFSRLEVLLPRLFAVLYILFGLGLILETKYGWFLG